MVKSQVTYVQRKKKSFYRQVQNDQSRVFFFFLGPFSQNVTDRNKCIKETQQIMAHQGRFCDN